MYGSSPTLPISRNHVVNYLYARSLRVSHVLQPQTMQKHYDTHRSTTKQSKRTQRTYDGLVEFSGGVFGIVEGSEKRRLEMEANEEGKRRMCAMEGIDEDDRDRPLQPKESELKLRERELNLRERELKLRERELKLREREFQLPHLPKEHEVPKARVMCTLQSQVIMSHTRVRYKLGLVAS